MKASAADPRFFEAFRRAAAERIEIPTKSKKSAQRLRARFHSLRAAMRVEHHYMLSFAERVSFSIVEIDTEHGQWALVARPADSEFISAFESAGIEVDDELQAEDEGAPPLDDFLEQFVEKDKGS